MEENVKELEPFARFMEGLSNIYEGSAQCLPLSSVQSLTRAINILATEITPWVAMGEGWSASLKSEYERAAVLDFFGDAFLGLCEAALRVDYRFAGIMDRLFAEMANSEGEVIAENTPRHYRSWERLCRGIVLEYSQGKPQTNEQLLAQVNLKLIEARDNWDDWARGLRNQLAISIGDLFWHFCLLIVNMGIPLIDLIPAAEKALQEQMEARGDNSPEIEGEIVVIGDTAKAEKEMLPRPSAIIKAFYCRFDKPDGSDIWMHTAFESIAFRFRDIETITPDYGRYQSVYNLGKFQVWLVNTSAGQTYLVFKPDVNMAEEFADLIEAWAAYHDQFKD